MYLGWAGLRQIAITDPPQGDMKNLNRLNKLLLFVITLVGVSFWGAKNSYAAIPFGSGSYVNLCGSGTAANVYSCSANCNVRTGSCAGSNNGVVKYVCNGRWDQCLESESYWSNYSEIGQIACGKTVQISVFDKKCRNEEGGWDASCKLQGYMVWYSGDCQTGVATTPTAVPTLRISPTLTPTPVPTLRVTPTNTPRPTMTPTPIVSMKVSPTLTPSPTNKPNAVCNKSCVLDSECGAGFKCLAGSCRNPSCSTDTTCFCGNVTVATGSGGKKSPETGGEEFLVLGGVLLVLGTGIFLRRAAAKI